MTEKRGEVLLLSALIPKEKIRDGWMDGWNFPSKIEWDLTNGPLRKLLELLDTQV